MINSDDSVRRMPDGRYPPRGPGMSSTFRCGACGQAKSVVGRRMQRVAGLRQYVCAGCVRVAP